MTADNLPATYPIERCESHPTRSPVPPRPIARRAVLLALMLAAPALRAQPDSSREGLWTLDADVSDRDAYLRLDMERHGTWGNWSTGSRVPFERLRGLTRAQSESAEGQNVRFELPRDAGTLRFEGWMRRGRGSGHFTWAPSPTFAAELARRGLERPDERDMFELTMHDVGFALVDELARQGYERPTLEELVTLGRHGVTLGYVTALDRLGYRVKEIEVLRQLRDHGVTPQYIEGLRKAGFRDLSAEDLRVARDHGVTPEVIDEYAALGYRDLDLDEVRTLVDHGVRPEFIKGMARAGYAKLSTTDLRRARDHGVTPAFARMARERAGRDVSLDEVIRMKDRGWDP